MTRARLQIHLATGVVLMLAASGLLALNLREEWHSGGRRFPGQILPYNLRNGDMRHQGWPLKMNSRVYTVSFQIETRTSMSMESYAPPGGYPWRLEENGASGSFDFPVLKTGAHTEWNYLALAANIAIALLLLLAIAVLSEVLFHRRPGINPPAQPEK